ncbi:MAG TPA: TonB family protein [Blastocatellia bacterium]|nr:TonB family protein [Blastocatellia bacterium]
MCSSIKHRSAGLASFLFIFFCAAFVVRGQHTMTPFSTRDGDFTVQMPGSNVEIQHISENYVRNGTVTSTDGESVYKIVYKCYCDTFTQGEKSAQQLNSIISNLKASLNSKVIKESDLLLEDNSSKRTINYPGKEIIFETEAELITNRVYLAKDMSYQLTSTAPKAKPSSAASGIFFASFKLGADWNLAKEPEGILAGITGPVGSVNGNAHSETGVGTMKQYAVHLEQPSYPPLARRGRIQGKVLVEIVIGEDGKVIAAAAHCGHPLLVPAAVEAARKSEFIKTTVSGVPVKVDGILVYNFNLQ